MIKKILVSVLLVFLLFVSQGASLLQAQITPSLSSVVEQFPVMLTFNLLASSDTNITDMRVHYVVEQTSYAQVISEGFARFTPGRNVTASWTWDLRQSGGIAPGSNIIYWWTIKDAQGRTSETNHSVFEFADQRFQWNNLNQGRVTLSWYQGNQSFADELMSAVESALVRLQNDTGAALQTPVKLYIYGTQQDLLGALVFPQEWTGGVAYTNYGIIAIAVPPDSLSFGIRAVAHELAHVVIFQMTSNPYNGIPTWLNEGFAMYSEGPLEASFQGFLTNAVATNSLISVRSLASPFSAIAAEAYLSYAESFSIIDYLVKTYGRDKMLELFNTFKEGNTYDGALMKVYGFDMDGLNTKWQEYVKINVPPPTPSSTISPLLITAIVVAGLAVILLFVLLVTRSRRR